MKSNFYNICAKRTCRIVQIAKYAPALCPKITHSHSFPRRMETPFSTKYQTIFRLFAGYRRTCVAGASARRCRTPENGTRRSSRQTFSFIGETVCLPYVFSLRENTFSPFNREQSSALICASCCLTRVAGASARRCRTPENGTRRRTWYDRDRFRG